MLLYHNCVFNQDQRFTNFLKILEPPQNSNCYKDDMKKVRYWGHTNVRCHYTEFRCWWLGTQDLCTPDLDLIASLNGSQSNYQVVIGIFSKYCPVFMYVGALLLPIFAVWHCLLQHAALIQIPHHTDINS